MAAWQRWLVISIGGPFLTGCATITERVEPATNPVKAAATLVVADGAGNFQMFSRSLRKALQTDGVPIEVVTCAWSHGSYRSLADHLDYAHAIHQGQKLAETMRTHRAEHPERAIHLAGHSAGAAVVLAALERLPPNFVAEVVLIAPSVSAEYEMRSALQAVDGKMHVFYSPHDYIYLGALTHLFGSADQFWCASAGRVGFRQDLAEDNKLVQHAWQPADAALGNYGGHFGAYQPAFLRQRVLPLFGLNDIRRGLD